jgi:hypothetical protein
MGPKKGGKKEAKPKEDEATLALMKQQQQIAAKNELRRRMEDEAKISKVNSMKIVNQWRKIMRIAKTESLKKDIEILSQNHERDVDRKDAILQMLDRDLEEAEDQYQMALRTHLVNIDTLIKLHDSRLYALERNFQQELKTLQEDFYHDKDVMLDKFQNEKMELKAIIEAIDQEEETRNMEAQHIFEQLREEIKGRNHEEIDTLRVALDDQIKDLEQEFENEHLQYLSQTQQRSHDFKEKSKNDLELTASIKKYKQRIDNLQMAIQHWRNKMKQLTRETEERKRLLTDEKVSIQKHYQQLKSRIKVYRTTQNQRLLHLSQSANQCKDALKGKLDVSRRVLQLSELCRRLETIAEQVLPFAPLEEVNTDVIYKDDLQNSLENMPAAQGHTGDSASTPTAGATATDREKKMKQAMLKATHQNAHLSNAGPVPHQSSVWNIGNTTNALGSSRPEYVAPNDRLANFYKQYNKIMLDNIAIAKEKERLMLENTQLQDLIQQYLNGTQLTGDTLREDNPLFVVNGRANLNHDPPVRKVKPLVQNAVEIQAATAKQRIV